jgi:hypothetical protein
MAGSDSERGWSRLERFALIAEIAGGVAVVISVAYLALQISDNNRLLRSQAHYNALEVTQRAFEIMVETADLADLLYECDLKPHDVAPSDWQRCKNYYFMQINGWEYTYSTRRGARSPRGLPARSASRGRA